MRRRYWTLPKSSLTTFVACKRLEKLLYLEFLHRPTFQVVTKIGFKPTRGADTRWLSVLNVCIDIRRCLDTLIQMKQDPAWASRMGKVVVDAITKINGLRNELDVCISVLAEFEEPVTALQVSFWLPYSKLLDLFLGRKCSNDPSRLETRSKAAEIDVRRDGADCR